MPTRPTPPCHTYWYPLYAFVRCRGHSPEDAQDLTQEFFAHFLQKGYFHLADRTRGRFRTFLVHALAWTNVMPQCVAHAGLGSPVAAGTNRFPVILHSHGWTCDRRLNSQNAEELASHGYIVAAVDHEDCHATVFPDARGVRYVPPNPSGDEGAGLRSRTNVQRK